jgi:hypothetical protein
MRSLVDMTMAAATVVVMKVMVVVVAVGEVEVMVTRDPLRTKGGKTIAVLMGYMRDVISTTACLSMSLRNAGPRKCQLRKIWPRRRSLH